MQFPNPIVNQLVIYGSADNLPDVRIGPDPQIIFYDGTAAFLILGLFPPETDPKIKFFDASVNAEFELRILPGQGAQLHYSDTVLINEGKLGFTNAAVGTPSVSLQWSDSNNGFTRLVLRNSGAANAQIYVYGPITAHDPAVSPLIDTAETWHNFGASAGVGANPGFFSNGWANFGAPWQVARYRLMPDGTVALEGLVNPGTMVAGTIMATLPSGYRPAADHIFTGGDGTAAGAVQEVLIRSNGQIQVGRITGTHSWEFRFSIPGI